MDDHARVLEAVSALLATDFTVAGTARDGAQALALAPDLAPDIFVLDITMPGLDGFQTLRELRRAGSRAPAVFLSMVDSDDYVEAAFRAGGRGYVVKRRAPQDLATAIGQVLAGRAFVPTVSALFRLADAGEGRGHAMQLRRDEDSFLDGLASLFDMALRRGDATCVIAPESIREGLGRRLRVRGWDPGAASTQDRYLAVDAQDALDRFMRDGLPDQDLLAEIAAELDDYRRRATGGSGRLTIFGNMSELLAWSGNTRAVVALEHAWTTQTHHLPFLTLCGYSTACFEEETRQDLFADTCGEHWALSHAQGV